MGWGWMVTVVVLAGCELDGARLDEDATTVTAVADATTAVEADATTETDTRPPEVVEPLEEPVIQLVVTVHLEGWQTSDEAVFERYVALLRERATLFERYGARLTLESKELTPGVLRWGDDVLSELRERGHDVAIHADVGGNPAIPYSAEQMASDLVARRGELAELGIEARHVSGVCAPVDWVDAVADAGFEAVTGLVAYCLMSLPEEARPAEYRTCASAAACHAAWPPDLAERLHPYEVRSGADWTTPVDDGRLTVIPISGGIHCLAEEADGDGGAIQCSLDEADADAFDAMMTSAVALAEVGRVNLLGFSWSFGSPFELEQLELFLDAAQAWVERGEARWSTVGEVLDLWASERGEPEPEPDPEPAIELAPGTTTTLRVPSATAPTSGLAVSVTVPSAPRWDEGAPIALVLPGGQVTSGLGDTAGAVASVGFVELRMALPGDPTTSPESRYDARGATSIAAVADVIAWARGERADADGHTLADRLGDATPLADVFGLVGLSNGGNLTLTTLALGEGVEAGRVDFVVNWESPVGDGMVGVEAGGNGNPNPAYDPDTGAWDLSALAWSATLPVGGGPGGGPSPFTGGLYFDFDHDGVAERDGGDFVLRPIVGTETGTSQARAWWSIRVMAEAERRGLVPSPRPAHVPTLAETTTWWRARDAEHQLTAAAARHPDLLFMVVASEVDHVQGQPDHPHVLAQYEGLRAAGTWVRLGPDAAYLAAVGVTEASLAAAPDNVAGGALDHQTIHDAVDPEGIPVGLAIRAGACELADRARAGDVRPDLEEDLR
ncbi:MAG: hypothetical protein IT385_13175 [Deltaproteobacteria bacterium]|nr:hypothetical protein [Deltaproteobacteria bacterium]